MSIKIVIPLAEVRQALVGMLGVCSYDETRYQMMGVRALFVEGKLELTATDGKIASKVSLKLDNPVGIEEHGADFNKTLPLELLLELKKIKAKEAFQFELELLERHVALVSPWSRRELLYIDGEYPNIDFIYKSAAPTIESGAHISFDAELLLNAAKSLAMAVDVQSTPKVYGAKVYIRMKDDNTPDRLSPLVLVSQNGTALVMPMRL